MLSYGVDSVGFTVIWRCYTKIDLSVTVVHSDFFGLLRHKPMNGPQQTACLAKGVH